MAVNPAPADEEIHHCLCCGMSLYRITEEKRRSSALISAGISGGMPIWARSIVKLNIALSVLTAKSLSVHMGISTGSIARMSAISSTDLEVSSNGRDKCKK